MTLSDRGLRNPTRIKNLDRMQLKTLVDDIGNIKWLEEERTVSSDKTRYLKNLFHGFLVDETGYSIKFWDVQI